MSLACSGSSSSLSEERIRELKSLVYGSRISTAHSSSTKGDQRRQCPSKEARRGMDGDGASERPLKSSRIENKNEENLVEIQLTHAHKGPLSGAVTAELISMFLKVFICLSGHLLFYTLRNTLILHPDPFRFVVLAATSLCSSASSCTGR